MRQGLTRVLADTPVRGGYLELQAGVTAPGGPFARGEAGWRPSPAQAVFGFGEWSPERSMAGVGWRSVW